MKKVLNTIIRGGDVESVTISSDDFFMYWGATSGIAALTNEQILVLDGANTIDEEGNPEIGYELRNNRLKTFYNYYTEGRHIVVCIPVFFGGIGQFQVGGLTNIFHELPVMVNFTDHNGRTYPMNTFISGFKYNGVIPQINVL
jgi:hypothetical protein